MIKNGRHPTITNITTFVPNDTTIGTEDHASILLLTGPNMGGKSTLMRQVALISIMAQIVRIYLLIYYLLSYYRLRIANKKNWVF